MEGKVTVHQQIQFIIEGGIVERFHTRPGIKPNTDAHHSHGVAMLCYIMWEGYGGDAIRTELLMAALSGDPKDIAVTDQAILEEFPQNESLARWIRLAQEKVHFQGLPARICWLGYGERHLAGLRFNELVSSGALSAPIVLGRDHLDCGSVASPYRETEAMADGSDAIASVS